MDSSTSDRVQQFRQAVKDTWAKRYRKPKLDPNFSIDLQHGWMVNALLELDAMTWQRWDYWARTMMEQRVLDEPIPEIWFHTDSDRIDKSIGYKHLEDCLNLIPNHGSWQGWGSWQYVDYFLDWLLYGFGYSRQKELPSDPSGCEGASARLYQMFNLGIFMANPYDYWGDLLAENKHGKHLGFYPTPHSVAELMTRMTFINGQEPTSKTCDPCLGTGRLLLHASNYSLRLYGADINPTVIKVSLINGYLFAPWLVKPFPFLDGELVHGDILLDIDGEQKTLSEVVAQGMMLQAQSNPAAAKYLQGAVYDRANAWKFEPIKKLVRVSDIPAWQESEKLEQQIRDALS
jgi:hypothetical protein